MSQLTISAVGSDTESSRVLRIALQAFAETAEIVTYTLPLTSAVCAELARVAPGIVLMDLPSSDPTMALDSMAAIHDLLPTAKIVAVGEAPNSVTVVGAMRAGACDFLESPLQTAELARFVCAGPSGRQGRAKIFTFINAKGGSGSTSLAVNMGLVLASMGTRPALIDLAVPGNTALHLDLKPSFTIVEAGRNLHRLDAMLLDGMMTKHASGLRVLAGANEPDPAMTQEQLATVLDVIASRYEYIVVDISTRLDGVTRTMCECSDLVMLVAQPDLPSIWNAQRVRRYVCSNLSPAKVKLVLNRHRKASGMSDAEYEKASGCELIWTVPNQYVTVSKAITNGIPVVQQSGELKDSFQQLARLLTGTPEQVRTILQQARGSKSLLERVASLRSFAAVGAKASA